MMDACAVRRGVGGAESLPHLQESRGRWGGVAGQVPKSRGLVLASLLKAFAALRCVRGAAFPRVAAVCALGLLPLSARSDDGPPAEQPGNAQDVQIDLTYSVESDTIAAGVGVGNVASWTLDNDQLSDLGLSTAGIESAADGAWNDATHDSGGESPGMDIIKDAMASNAIPGLVGYDKVSKENGSGWYGELDAVIATGKLSRVVTGDDAGHSLGGAADLDVGKVAENVGLDDVEALDLEKTAPAVRVGSSDYVPGLGADVWRTIWAEYNGQVLFVGTDWVPQLTFNGGRVNQFIVTLWNEHVIPALDSFFLALPAGLLKIRVAMAFAMVFIVGKKLLYFTFKTGPVLLNVVVNILHNGVLKDVKAEDSSDAEPL